MFTGLVRDIGVIEAIQKDSEGATLDIRSTLAQGAELGASVCCSGCCLTVTEKNDNTFRFYASHETLDKTTLGSWEKGDHVNLEPSLRMGDELGGHFVFGHVDDLATLLSSEKDGESWRLKIKPKQQFMPYISSKGSVSLDGISLTVNEVEHDHFGVNIIPHTWEHTTLQYKVAGDALNFEVDMLARYVARMMDHQKQEAA